MEQCLVYSARQGMAIPKTIPTKFKSAQMMDKTGLVKTKLEFMEIDIGFKR